MIGIGMWRTNLPQPRRLGGILIDFHQPFIVTVGGIFCFEFVACGLGHLLKLYQMSKHPLDCICQSLRIAGWTCLFNFS